MVFTWRKIVRVETFLYLNYDLINKQSAKIEVKTNKINFGDSQTYICLLNQLLLESW